MKRRLLNLLTALSLVLCGSVAAAWVRSHSAADYVSIPVAGTRFEAGWVTGCFFIGTVDLVGDEPWLNSYPPMDAEDVIPVSPYAHRIGRLALALTPSRRLAFVPAWLALAGLSPLPLLLLLRRRPRPAGRCRACGYDLRATPNRCPECGTKASVSDAV